MSPVRHPIALPDGTYIVPGNRWELVGAMTPAEPPTVSVVIPYFDAQARLDRMLTALARQSHPLDRLQVIVADDGSPAAPTIARDFERLSVEVVRQPDAGFRAAAARNLGARRAAGTVLCFLDDDTVPEPGYVAAISRLPALLPDAVVTGRRRHGDLAAMSPAQVAAWLDGMGPDGTGLDGTGPDGTGLNGNGPGPASLGEPSWLRDEHEASANLARIGSQSYRYLISAVLACRRSLFDDLGGFDESIVGYGGEDWELAHRAFCAGAVLAHVPDAIAWHDGPSWAERRDAEGRRREKNAETAALARLIPDPAATAGAWTGRPRIVVEVDTEDEEPAAVIVTVAAVLTADVDAGVWLHGSTGRAVKADQFGLDPRVAIGAVDAGAAATARIRVTCSRPVRIVHTSWPALIEAVDPSDRGCDNVGQLVLDTGDGMVTVTASRARHRVERWTAAVGSPDLLDDLFGRTHLDAAATGVTAVPRRPDLAHELAHLRD